MIKAGAIGTNSFTIRNKASGETDEVFEVEFAQFSDTRVALNWTNKAPDVAVTNKTLIVNEWQKVGDWIKASDGDGDAVTQYRFWDGGTGATSGYFWTLDNAHHAASTNITVNASDLGNVWFRGGQVAGAETLWVQSFDGMDWGAWKQFTATTQAPIVNQTIDGTKLWGGAVLGGAGNDTVTYASATHAIKVDLKAGRADGAGKTAQITSIENVTGAVEAKNEMFGDTKANTLIGGNLDDFLYGGGGADILLGGKGNDSISFHNGVARIDGGEGFDYLLADESTDATGINFKVLGSNIEYVGGRYGHDIVDARGLSYGITTSTYSGNDTFYGSNHIDVFQADIGIDTFVISGKRADYGITPYGTDGNWWLITDGAGVWDAIQNVEIVKFSDATLNVSNFFLL